MTATQMTQVLTSSHLGADLEAKPRPLGSILASRAILVAAVGLVLYTVFELLVDPPVNVMNFFTHHFLHVVATAIFIWIACWMTLCDSIFRPVEAIFHHLYHIRLGRLEKLQYRTEVKEMMLIINGINLLVERLEKSPRPEALSYALGEVQQLRGLLRETPDPSDESRVEIMRTLTRLESHLLDLRCLQKPNAS